MTLNGKTILLTGGTGSFGHQFVSRVLAKYPEAKIRIYSRDELKQSEMQKRFPSKQLRWFIGDVRDRSRMTRAAQGADIFVHAAAMKQVPACEYNPFEAVRTNVLGAQHIVDACIDAGVSQVVALSTDKACNPVNLYGATKLCSEKLFVHGNAYAAQFDTRLSCVRYGNVIGSRGSVVPLFREQAQQGKLTITDERMTRFWLTLDQAVDLVFHAIDTMHGGEIFVPKIPSVRVTDLAEAIAPGIPYDVTGNRPGEKLHETLLTFDEARHTIETDQHYIILPEHNWWNSPADHAHAAPAAEGFVYSSDANDWWLEADELAGLLTPGGPDIHRQVERLSAITS
jgi:UDP-N-acetylglucosamine 4,6-dehydratase